MKKILTIVAILLLAWTTVNIFGAETFTLIDQWKHSKILGHETFSFVNSDGHLVAGFYMVSPMIIRPKSITSFAHRGQGPNEMTDIYAAFLYKGDFFAFEHFGKAKVFTLKNDTYVWKETKWFKTGKYVHIAREGLFLEDKFFLSGMEFLGNEGQKIEVAFVKVYNEEGKPLKTLVKKTYETMNRFYEMRHHIIEYKSNSVFYLPANELNVTVISPVSLEVTRNVPLEIPTFYKPMPNDFYIFKNYNDPKIKTTYQLDLETWAMGYSAITEAAVDGEFLVVQVRTCDEKVKKFALLFYNVENNFKLERTVFTDDFLLDIKDGKYYCFANGNPGRDDDTDECIIDIYSWKK